MRRLTTLKLIGVDPDRGSGHVALADAWLVHLDLVHRAIWTCAR